MGKKAIICCGRCMMAVRDKFHGWTEAQLKAYTPSTDLDEWWNSSPTYLEQLEGMGITGNKLTY